MTGPDSTSQLYAVIEAGEGVRERLEAALAAAQIASVLIVPQMGARLDAAAAKPLVRAAQKAGAAALLADDAELARMLAADGVHLSAVKDLAGAYALARAAVGKNAVVGVDPGISRHDAMTLAEAGADYVAFGAPANLKDRDKARTRRNDLVAWWAEIFEAPCVALDVETREEAETLAAAGADFIGVRLMAAASPQATSDFVAEISNAVAVSETAS